jgi:hypothetical protein
MPVFSPKTQLSAFFCYSFAFQCHDVKPQCLNVRLQHHDVNLQCLNITLQCLDVSPISVISQNGYDRFDSNILKIPASTVSSNLRANKL